MAVETITIECPECETRVKVRSEVEGKKVRCKECEHVYVARTVSDKVTSGKPAAKKPAAKAEPAKKPAAKAAPAKNKGKPESEAVKPAAEAPAPKPATDDEDDGNPYGLTDINLAARCPSCANEMESEDAIICLHCGYNTQTRVAVKTRKVHDTTGGDIFLWQLPGYLCVLGILAWIAIDLVYCLKINDWLDDEDSWVHATFRSGGVKLWLVITSLFFCFFMGKFAVKRLILDNKPPEVEKN